MAGLSDEAEPVVHHLPPTVKQLGDPRHNATWQILPAAPEVCSQCAIDHEPQEPHNRDSLHYQYTFHGEHGRWPSWADAMAHCSPQVKSMWRLALAERGVIVEETPNEQP